MLPEPEKIGTTLFACHEILRSFPDPLPKLAILTESLALLGTLHGAMNRVADLARFCDGRHWKRHLARCAPGQCVNIATAIHTGRVCIRCARVCVRVHVCACE